MPFLAGGHALSLPAKIALSNTALLIMAAELIDDEDGWRDNLEDTGAILTFAGTLYVLWLPPVVQGAIAARIGMLFAPLAIPAAIVTSTVIVGGIVSYFVDPEEGLQNYKDFISEPTKIPERIGFTAKTIYEETIEDPLVAAATRYVGWVDRRIEEIQSVWAVTMPQSPW